MKPTEVSSQMPQLHPPPPSGESSKPAAGMVLSQQSGRNRFQVVLWPCTGFQTVKVSARKKTAPVEQA